MEYNFVKFSDFNVRTSHPTISVTKNNTFGLSSSFMVENGLNKYDYACLYYDTRSKSVGIRFTNDKSETSKFTITKNKDGNGANLIAHSFFRKSGIDAEKFVGKYTPKKLSLDEVGIEEPGAMFVIDLGGGS
jgi:hypothetical protein